MSAISYLDRRAAPRRMWAAPDLQPMPDTYAGSVAQFADLAGQGAAMSEPAKLLPVMGILFAVLNQEALLLAIEAELAGAEIEAAVER